MGAPEPGPTEEAEVLARVAAHDLAAPIRAIDGFAAALLEDHGDTLDDKGQDYLARIRRAAARLQKLSDGLVACLRGCSQPLEVERVDLSAAARDAVRTLADRERVAALEVEGGLALDGDPRLVALLASTLLEHVIALSPGPARVRLTVGREAGETARFFVAAARAPEEGASQGAVSRSAEPTPDHALGTLRLSLCRIVLQRHRGELEVDSGAARASFSWGAT